MSKQNKATGYNGNENLPKAGTRYALTQHQLEEYKRCMESPAYFAENYFKIVTVDDGLQPMKLYDFQREAAESYLDSNKMILATSRQIGKTTIATVIILHYVMFNEWKTVFILGNKESTAVEVLERIQLAYEYLPSWLKVGVEEWNKTSVVFENGSKIRSAATSSDGIRGKSCVTGDMQVNIEINHNSGEFQHKKITVKELYDLEKELSGKARFKVFGKDKFEHYDNVVYMGKKPIWHVYVNLSDDPIRCTADHKFLMEDNTWKEAQDLKKNDKLYCGIITSVEKQYTKSGKELIEDTFDFVNVSNGNMFMCNGIIVHNCNLLYLDECAFIDNWPEFSASVLPVLSSGKKTKLVMTSTPKGLNHFYEYYVGAKNGTNGFKLLEVKWNDVPGRDEKWRKETLETLNGDEIRFRQEYCVEFMGSSDNLIDGSILKNIKGDAVGFQPIHISPSYGYTVYEQNERNNSYVITVDVSRGKGLDYSAFQVIDVSSVPYKQVAVFKNNIISPRDFATFIVTCAKQYNDAMILVEVNDLGAQVSDIIYYDYEYENIIFTESAGSRGKRVSINGNRNADKGIRTTTLIKATGCSMLKLLIEQRKLIIRDLATIDELSTFSKKGKSYEAEQGKHDDLVMCLVLFSWLTTDSYFKSLTDIDIMHSLRELNDDQIYNELTPFGIIQTYDDLDTSEQTSINIGGIEYNIVNDWEF